MVLRYEHWKSLLIDRINCSIIFWNWVASIGYA